MYIFSRFLVSFRLGNNYHLEGNNFKKILRHGIIIRFFSVPVKNVKESSLAHKSKLSIPSCNFDVDYICNPKNNSEILSNIKNRKGVGNIDDVQRLWDTLNTLVINSEKDNDNQNRTEHFNKLFQEFLHKIAQIPNRTHPNVIIGDETKAKVLETIGQQKAFNFEHKTFEKLCQKLDILHTAHLGHVSGNRSYFLKGALAKLEQALIQFCVDRLDKLGFTLMSVPDLVYPSIIEACSGMTVQSGKNCIFSLDPTRHGNICLSGTAEIALGAYFMNKCLKMEDLPQKVAAVSRCYRAEIDREYGGIYRVHEFTKVEMFAVVKANSSESDNVLKELVDIEKQLFTELGLHFRVLDMPSQELGASAFRKIDIEAWMPGQSFYGEISSASNCTDFQSRRLNITCNNSDNPNSKQFVHTLNGTACAIPRMLIALLETHQQSDMTIHIVKPLQPFFGEERIKLPTKKSRLYWIKLKSQM